MKEHTGFFTDISNIEVKGLWRWHNLSMKRYQSRKDKTIHTASNMFPDFNVKQLIYTGTSYCIQFHILNKLHTIHTNPFCIFFKPDGTLVYSKDLKVNDEITWLGLKCKWCEKPFSLKNEKIIRTYRTNMYCSKECRKLYKAVEFTDSNRKVRGRIRGTKGHALCVVNLPTGYTGSVVSIKETHITKKTITRLVIENTPPFIINGGLLIQQ